MWVWSVCVYILLLLLFEEKKKFNATIVLLCGVFVLRWDWLQYTCVCVWVYLAHCQEHTTRTHNNWMNNNLYNSAIIIITIIAYNKIATAIGEKKTKITISTTTTTTMQQNAHHMKKSFHLFTVGHIYLLSQVSLDKLLWTFVDRISKFLFSLCNFTKFAW